MASYRSVASHLTRAITCHAVSRSGNLLAICPNNTDVIILERSGGSWSVTARLEGHDQIVSGLHFFEDAQGHVRLVSSSHDRNSYVWTRQPNTLGSSSSTGAWSQELVITKLSRAGLCVQWSGCGRKFAIGRAPRQCSHRSSRASPPPEQARLNRHRSFACLELLRSSCV